MAKGTIGILVAAAGASSRMRGRDKLLEIVDGKPLIARQTEQALATGYPVLVTLPPAKPARAHALAAFTRPETAIVPRAHAGLSESLRAGARWAMRRRLAGLLVVLADMPDLGAGDFLRIIREFKATSHSICRGSDDEGHPGHPVMIPARLFPALLKLAGDQGAQPLFKGAPVHLIPLPGSRALTDLDTPEAWAAWRLKRSTK